MEIKIKIFIKKKTSNLNVALKKVDYIVSVWREYKENKNKLPKYKKIITDIDLIFLVKIL